MAIKMNNNENDDKILSEINMTPLIDIMLVLLIIFMVTSSISLESGLDIDIPKTSSKTNANEGNSIIISLNKSGKIFVQGQSATLENLEKLVKKAMAVANSKLVVLEGDSSSTLGIAINIMDIAKRAGATKFAIAADQE